MSKKQTPAELAEETAHAARLQGMPASLVGQFESPYAPKQERKSVLDVPASLAEHCYGDPALCLCLGRSLPYCQKVKQQLSSTPLCECPDSLCKGWGATAGICRDAASYSIPPRNVPQPIPAPHTALLDFLTEEVLTVTPKSGIRQALGLLLHELGRRGMPAYGNLARNPALLAEQAAVIPPIGQFSSAEAAIAQGIDPTEAVLQVKVEGSGATVGPIPAEVADFWRAGTTDSTSAHSPPGVTISTPGHLPLTTAAASTLCSTSAGILTLQKDTQ